jgi:methylmalonyl-CoA mutase N-terminal domain/subunit
VGGVVESITTGALQSLIGDAAAARQVRLESGEDVVIGVNKYATDESFPDVQGFELNTDGISTQLARLHEVRQTRDSQQVATQLNSLRAAASDADVNLMPTLIDCATAYCTIGEITQILRDVWGEFTQPKVI